MDGEESAADKYSERSQYYNKRIYAILQKKINNLKRYWKKLKKKQESNIKELSLRVVKNLKVWRNLE